MSIRIIIPDNDSSVKKGALFLISRHSDMQLANEHRNGRTELQLLPYIIINATCIDIDVSRPIIILLIHPEKLPVSTLFKALVSGFLQKSFSENKDNARNSYLNNKKIKEVVHYE